jgi:flagellar hook assembly protein FlgD
MVFKYFLISGCMLLFLILEPGRCQEPLSEAPQKVWIFFTAKEPATLSKTHSAAELAICSKALERRLKISRNELIDRYDLPVNPGFVQQIEATGATVVVHSRWLNAVSARATPLQRGQIQKFPFVKKINPVVTFRRPDLQTKSTLLRPATLPQTHVFDYGVSLTQNQQIRVPEVHNLGITGQGVRILMLDTGFNYQQHEAFSRLKVKNEFDFLFGDSVTQNETGQDYFSQHNHGTQTLSTIGAFLPGQLIGPAFDATFLLAKTENVVQETQIEEDYWVAGLEWGERLGADVASSSLGYNDWYEYSDFDGKTAVTTIAADIAVKKGMVVVNSMGNEGHAAGSIIAPADADSVISVGAVNSENNIASFSSVGPTWDLRIKPDVMAMGVGVSIVSPNSASALTTAQGTSFSCPLVAGVAALILSAHPELTPIQVRDALRETADRAQNPGNEYGWGTVNALDAVLFHGLVFGNQPQIQTGLNGEIRISINALSKNGIAQVFIHWRQTGNVFTSQLMTQSDLNQFEILVHENEVDQNSEFYFSAIDADENTRTHPYNAPEGVFRIEGMTAVAPSPSRAPKLFLNFPNPFQGETSIQYSIPTESLVELGIYSMQKTLLRKLVEETKPAGMHGVVWDGKTAADRRVTEGRYLVILKNNGTVLTQTIELIQSHQLYQNFPNPFNQSTRLNYQLSKSSQVELKIYNTLGQWVATLVETYQPAGHYRLRWDGQDEQQKNVPGGIYFYVLKVDGMYNIKKMTLLR